MMSFVWLSVLLGFGYWLRRKLRLLQRLYLPASVVGGLAGLLVLQLAGAVDAPIPTGWTAGWSALPGILVNVVFACLFLGVSLPSAARMWRCAGLQLAYGQMIVWGQYAIGLGLVFVLLGPVFRVHPLFGVILPVGFEGGHGTAGGLGPVFDRAGWSEGRDFALASATVGLISAIVVGMAMINWAVRKGHVAHKSGGAGVFEEQDWSGLIPAGDRPAAGRLTVSGDVIESLSLHLAIVAFAILIGAGFKQVLILVESHVPVLAKHRLLDGFPLFPLCMLGGLLIQMLAGRLDPHDHIDHGLMRRIQNTALDYLVVAAIATLRIDVVAAGWVPLVILLLSGIVWNVFCVLAIARRIFKDAWFERGIVEMGQSMGVTATGLLLLRVVDPNYKTRAAEAFACKQLMHEPFMGGGLWTGMAIPLMAAIGSTSVLGISIGALILCSVLAVILSRRQRDD